MKVTMFAIGTRGDVEPCIGFARRLQERGHDVRLAAYRNFRPLVESEGLPFAPIAADLDEIQNSEHSRAVRASGANLLKALWHMRGLLDAFPEAFWESYEDACAGADVLLSHPSSPQVSTIGERDGIPVVLASVIPMIGRSRAVPCPYVAPPRDSAWLNYLSHLAFEQIVWQPIRPALNRWRRQMLRLPAERFFGPYGAMQRRPILYGYSRHLLPPPPDWPRTIRVTGFWETSLPSSWRPPASLIDFLGAGPPPVLVSFGSMKVEDVGAHLSLVREAVRRAGRRGLLVLRLSDEQRASLPEFLHAVDEVPYRWLFPRLSAVVTHGGAGTVHRALIAGLPSAACYHFGDQVVWSRRVHALGAGPPPVPARGLTVDTLTELIQAVTTRESYRRSAESVGRAIAAEDGLDRGTQAFLDFAEELLTAARRHSARRTRSPRR